MNRRDSLKLLLAASGSTLFPPLWAAPGAEHATPLVPAFSGLPMGEIKPRGWIREQMTRDLRDGFAGHLDELCREASSGIFTRHRNSGLAANDSNAAKINWWNGETEGNWRAGLIGMAYLAEEKQAMDKAAAFVRQVLDCQDKDGYLGVFAPDLRFGMTGELWTQACLMRGLLDFAELARDVNVHHAVVRAMDLTISVYGRASTPVASGPGGQGMSHDLMICDVAERLYRATGDAK